MQLLAADLSKAEALAAAYAASQVLNGTTNTFEPYEQSGFDFVMGLGNFSTRDEDAFVQLHAAEARANRGHDSAADRWEEGHEQPQQQQFAEDGSPIEEGVFVQQDGDGNVGSVNAAAQEEEYEREALAADLIEQLAPPQARDFNLDIIRADRFDLLDFIQIFESYPMMAEMRLVVLRDVHDLTADQCRGLERILESGVETTRLIAVGHKIDMRRKIFRQFAKLGRAVEFRPPYDNQVPQWIQRYAKRAGIAIEPTAVQMLSQYVGAKPRELVSEIEKLISFAGTPIKAEAVEQVAEIYADLSADVPLHRIHGDCHVVTVHGDGLAPEPVRTLRCRAF